MVRFMMRQCVRRASVRIGRTTRAWRARSHARNTLSNVPLTEQRDICTVRAVTSALPLPKYHQIYLVLREQLHEGRFTAGVPGEIALMHEFGVARVTVRKALELLAAERLIRRTPGRGTVPLPTAAAPRAQAGMRRDNFGGDGERFDGLFENLIGMGAAHPGQGAVGARAAVPRRGGRCPRSRSRRSGAEGAARAVHARGSAVAHHHLRAAGAGTVPPPRAGQEADPDAPGAVGRAGRSRHAGDLGAPGRCRGGARTSRSPSDRHCCRCSASCSTAAIGRCSGCSACTGPIATSTAPSCHAWGASMPGCGSTSCRRTRRHD